jgi:stress response protein YsnF
MATPTTPTGMHAADEEHVRVLDESLRTGVHTVSEKVIPLVEETASIGKREVVTGRVRVQPVTDTIEELARADVQRESVEVTRVPIDRMVETAPEIRTEGDVTIVSVVEEVLVVEKRLVLKEELHIRRRVTTEAAEVPVTLRKQRAIMERVAPDTPAPEEEIPQ